MLTLTCGYMILQLARSLRPYTLVPSPITHSHGRLSCSLASHGLYSPGPSSARSAWPWDRSACNLASWLATDILTGQKCEWGKVLCYSNVNSRSHSRQNSSRVRPLMSSATISRFSNNSFSTRFQTEHSFTADSGMIPTVSLF